MVTLTPVQSTVGASRPRVEVLGVFGAGKTSLARRLETSAVELLLEDHELNPFWGDSRLTEITGYLAYDLAFLLQHVQLLASWALSKTTATVAVCDWSLLTDKLWASLRLGADFGVYEAAHENMRMRLGPPLGYVFLDEPTDVICSRIIRRGRPPESKLLSQIEGARKGVKSIIAHLPRNQVITVRDQIDYSMVQKHIFQWQRNAHAHS